MLLTIVSFKATKFFFTFELKDAQRIAKIDESNIPFKKKSGASDCERASSATNTYNGLARDCSFRPQFRPSFQSFPFFLSGSIRRAEILI